MSDKCALIVDDDAPIRLLLAATLKRYGITSDEAADGQSAISRLREKEYDVVLLDLMMPKVNGLEVLAHIDKTGIDTQVIILSAAAQPMLDELSSPHIIAAHRKPFDLEALIDDVLRACGLPARPSR